MNTIEVGRKIFFINQWPCCR